MVYLAGHLEHHSVCSVRRLKLVTLQRGYQMQPRWFQPPLAAILACGVLCANCNDLDGSRYQTEETTYQLAHSRKRDPASKEPVAHLIHTIYLEKSALVGLTPLWKGPRTWTTGASSGWAK